MIFVDTNYFIRFLLQDNEKQHEEAKALFTKGAEGKENLITSTIVFFEIYWVFKSFYNKTKPELIKILQKVLSMNFISFEEKDILLECLSVFNKTNLDDLEDCYNLAFVKLRSIKGFKTFDQKLTKAFKIW